MANFAAKQSPGDPGKQTLGELNQYPDTPGVQEFCTWDGVPGGSKFWQVVTRWAWQQISLTYTAGLVHDVFANMAFASCNFQAWPISIHYRTKAMGQDEVGSTCGVGESKWQWPAWSKWKRSWNGHRPTYLKKYSVNLGQPNWARNLRNLGSKLLKSISAENGRELPKFWISQFHSKD